jgi:hypothetical protein
MAGILLIFISILYVSIYLSSLFKSFHNFMQMRLRDWRIDENPEMRYCNYFDCVY